MKSILFGIACILFGGVLLNTSISAQYDSLALVALIISTIGFGFSLMGFLKND